MYEKFRELLSESHKTPYMVSKDTGISQTAFSNWKSGRCQPSLDSLRRLAIYFGKPIEYFLDEEKEVV